MPERNAAPFNTTYGPEFGYTLASGRLFCDFGLFQEWASDLVGRQLWTHHFADKDVWEEIRAAFEADMTELYGPSSEVAGG